MEGICSLSASLSLSFKHVDRACNAVSDAFARASASWTDLAFDAQSIYSFGIKSLLSLKKKRL